jgi:uncharacterized membrane protein (UPF0127 family)
MKRPGSWQIAAAATLVVALFAAFAASRLPARAPYAGQPPLRTGTYILGGHELTLEIASSAEEQEKGLSDRLALAPNAGMIFPQNFPGRPGFWMKGMRFPLDFIYVRDGKAVEIKKDIRPTLLSPPFFPTAEVDAVIEVNAGWVAEHGVRVGDGFSPI